MKKYHPTFRRSGVSGLAWLAAMVLANVVMPAVGNAAIGGSPGAGTPTENLPEPIYWKQTRFLIPYQWSGPAQGNSAQLVRLFISKDLGTNWQPISEAKPDLRGFTYHAEIDGEYWFSIRTIDSQGRSWPKGPHQPELRVIIDTQFPQIAELGALLATDGSMEIFWKASDQQLAADGIKLEIKTATDNGWQPVAMANAKTRLQPGMHQGTVRAQVPAGTRQVSLRAEAYDQAGNRSFRGAEVTLNEAGLSSVSQFPIMITGRQKIPENVIRGGNLQLRVENTPPIAGAASGEKYINPFATKPVKNAASGLSMVPVTLQRTSQLSSQRSSQPWPTNGASSTTTNRIHARPVASPAYQRPAATGNQPIENSKPRTPFQAVSMGGQSQSDTTNTVPNSISNYAQTPYADTLRRNLAAPVQPAAKDTGAWLNQFGVQLPPGISPMIVSTRTFDLEYSLDSVGQWGVSRVELWGTRDGGKSWRNYALDDDNRSPLRVTVEGEGIYGFRIVAHAASGLAANAPKPGDVPELWVGVDLERPQAELLSVQQGVGNLADHLVIRWRANDANLAAQPVNLFYGSRAGGPWSAIATGLQNTGEYSWRTERHLPSQFYIRLEVRDAAGNVATHQTPQPVILNRAAPTARLRGVLTPGGAASVPSSEPPRR